MPHSKGSKSYWLMKSEPSVFSLEDLKASPGRTTSWEGVRNYQARNFMRDAMRVGDGVLFYHSNCRVPGVVGLAEVVREAYPDPSAFDPRSPYHDPKGNPLKPRWIMVDVKYQEAFPHMVTLSTIRKEPKLSGMLLLRRVQRLSIQPVTPQEFKIIVALGRKPEA